MADKCSIIAWDGQNPEIKYPLSRSGWTAAHKHASRYSNGNATLLCPPGGIGYGIPLYQCRKGECFIERYEGSIVLAGARRRRRKR